MRATITRVCTRASQHTLDALTHTGTDTNTFVLTQTTGVCTCLLWDTTTKQKDPGEYSMVDNDRLYQDTLCKYTTPTNTSIVSESLSLKSTAQQKHTLTIVFVLQVLCFLRVYVHRDSKVFNRYAWEHISKKCYHADVQQVSCLPCSHARLAC